LSHPEILVLINDLNALLTLRCFVENQFVSHDGKSGRGVPPLILTKETAARRRSHLAAKLRPLKSAGIGLSKPISLASLRNRTAGLGVSPETEGRSQQEAGDLLAVVAITDPRILEDVGVVPDFGDDGGGVVRHVFVP